MKDFIFKLKIIKKIEKQTKRITETKIFKIHKYKHVIV